MDRTNQTPHADRQGLVDKSRGHLWHHITQHQLFDTAEPMVVTSGQGLIIRDARGRQFLDATSGGVWCVNVGYGRKSIARAVAAQLEEMPYYAGTAGNVPAIELAAVLHGLLPRLSRVFYSNSGSEANEKGFKMARQLSRLAGGDRYKIIYRQRDYHGTTLGALSATGQQERVADYGPLLPGFVEFPHCLCYRCAFGKTYPACDIDCARALDGVIGAEGPESVAAVIVEPITAGGGIIVPVPEYLGLVGEICRRHGVLLIIDEVVCGFGRTGEMFGHLHFDVDPDIVTMAKGLASAYMPISVTMTKEAVFEAFKSQPADKMAYFRDISTFGGCAGSCAAALESIRITEAEDLCENSRLMGVRLLDGLKSLEGLPQVGQARGLGLFAGLELVRDKATKEPVAEAYLAQVVADIAAQGVLVGRTNRSIPGFNNTITLAPALVADQGHIDTIVGAIQTALIRNTDF